ncbi:MAG: protein-disulfide reductase DsbD [Granulosicoccaceae bacterium]
MTTDRKHYRRFLALGSLAATALILTATLPVFAAKFSLGGADSKPLPVDEAYLASAEAEDRSSLTVTFDIAEGYYLYRDKTVITSSTTGVELSEPFFPKAIVINDEFFGETATYREQATFVVPIDVSASLSNIDLNIKFQGCADIGLCYPPTDYKIRVELPTPPSTTTSGALAQLVANSSGNLTNQSDPLPQSTLSSKVKSGKAKTGLELFGEEDNEPILSPEQAFIPSATVNNNTVTVSWFIEPEYYLYRDKMKFSFADDAASITNIAYSESQIQSDAFFGDVPIFRNQATAILSTTNSKAGIAALDIKYQGCADIGVCFPPSDTSLPIKLASFTASTVNATNDASTSAKQLANVDNNTPTAAPQAEQDRIRAKLSSSSLWINAASFFVLGLLLSFTPCVFPMIPILSSLILGQGKSISTGKAFGLSLTYVLAMAVTYTLVGIFIGLSGYNLQAWFQNPWILSVFALIFVLLSLSMFGFYEIQMPATIQSKLNNVSSKQEGGNWIGVAIMGVLSALIVGPCVTAPLVGALIYIAETGDATVGGVALFSMSMGMGVPLLIIGTSAGKLMPKAGAWMDITKVLFGLAMLAMAIWMLSRFLPASVIMILSALLAICGGIYLATSARFGATISWISRSLGLIITLYGAALLIGLLAGSNSLITPLAQIGGGSGSEQHEIEFERVKSEADLDTVLSEAANAGQYVLLDYYADWCVSCKEMEAYTFTDPAVQSSLENVRLIQADVTKNDAEDQAMLKRFGLFGPPAILFFAPGAGELSNARVVGYMKAGAFNTHLKTNLQTP